MNNSNLIPFNAMSLERHKELSRSGGIASVKARKEKKTMKECLLTMLYDIKPTKEVDKLLDEFNVCDEEYRTNAMAICIALINRAMKRKC